MRYLILGASGLAREVYAHLCLSMKGQRPDVQFIDDVTPIKEVRIHRDLVIPVLKTWDSAALASCQIVPAVGDPKGKKIMVEKALALGLKPANPIIAGTLLQSNIEVGKGSIVAPGSILTTDIRLGDFVLVNLNCSIGHDTVIEDYCTINPGCNISGGVHLGVGVSLGTGTVIREKIKIAKHVVTGAQSCIVADVPEADVVMVGVPAKRLR